MFQAKTLSIFVGSGWHNTALWYIIDKFAYTISDLHKYKK